MPQQSNTSNGKAVVAPLKPKPSDMGVELGVAQVLPGSAWSSWGLNIGQTSDKSIEIGNSPYALPIENLVEMRRKDGQARALIRLFTLPIRSALKEAEWVEPEGGSAEKETEFANLMFRLPPQAGGMTVPLSRFLRQTLLALVEGYAVFEEVRQIPEDGELKGKITLRKMAYRDSRTIRFRVDDTGGFDGVRQVANLAGRVKDIIIPKDKVWYYAANEEENPYYGVSYFESAWYHFDIKRKLYYIAHLASQFAAVPGRVGMTPPNPDPTTLKQFREALANFAFNTAMIAPNGYSVAPFNGNTGFDFLRLIDHHNKMMSMSVLAKFIDTEDRQVLIDNGRGDASADLFVMALEAIMSEIAESWTVHLMPKYIDWNFNTKVYPVFRFGQLADSAKDAIKETFLTVVTAGTLNCTPEFVRELEKKLATRLGLDIDYEDIEKAEEEAAKAEQEAQQEAADQQAQMQGMEQFTPQGARVPGALPGPATQAGSAALQAARQQQVGMAASIDDLVAAAQELLVYSPDDAAEGPVDDL